MKRSPIRRRSWLARKTEIRRGRKGIKRSGRPRAKGGHRFKGERDPAYLAHVRGLPCLLRGVSPCWGPVDPHHTLKQSHEGADHSAVPLCRWHHDEVETTPRSVYRARHPGLDLAAVARGLWSDYHREAA